MLQQLTALLTGEANFLSYWVKRLHWAVSASPCPAWGGSFVFVTCCSQFYDCPVAVMDCTSWHWSCCCFFPHPLLMELSRLWIFSAQQTRESLSPWNSTSLIRRF